MPRLVLAGVVGLMLLAFCTYSVVTTWVIRADAPLNTVCDNWLDHPDARWLALRDCLLDINMVVLESDQGDFEKLGDRQKGLSSKLYPAPPKWIAAWIPVRSQGSRAGLVRAAYRIESQDLLRWINTLDRANEKERDLMWADPVPLRRIARPGVLPGRAEKPASEALQKTFGQAAVSLMVVRPGTPPPPTPPAPGILSGLAGLVLLAVVVRGVTRANSLHLADPTAAQHVTQVNVSDVKLEIGALEQLRADERRERKGKRG